MLRSGIQGFRRELDTPLRYEDETTPNGESVRTQRLITCPDCNQEVSHMCPAPLITSSTLQPRTRRRRPPPLNLESLDNLTRSQTDPTVQGNSRGEWAAQSTSASIQNPTSFLRRLPGPPSNSISASTSHSNRPPSYYSITSFAFDTAPSILSGESAAPHSPTFIRRLLPTPSHLDIGTSFASTFHSASHDSHSHPPPYPYPSPSPPPYLLTYHNGPTSQENPFDEFPIPHSSTFPRRLPPTPNSSDFLSAFTSNSNDPFPHGLTSVSRGNTASLETHVTSPTIQQNLFSERPTAHSAGIRRLPPTPNSADVFSIFLPRSTNLYSQSTTSATFSDSPTYLRGSTSHETPLDECVTAQPASHAIESATSPIRRLPPTPTSSNISVFASHSPNPRPHPPTPTGSILPIFTSHSPAEYAGGRSTPDLFIMSSLGTIDCGQRAPHVAASNLRLPTVADSSPLFAATPSFSGASMSSFIPTVFPSSRKGADQEGEANWSLTYNSEVRRVLDVSFVCSLNLECESRISCLKYNKDGKLLALAFEDNGTTQIYDVQNGEKICTLRDIINGKDIDISTVCFSPNQLYLAAGDVDGSVRIWEISKKRIRNIFVSLFVDAISCVDFSPDGRLVASGNYDSGILEVWNWRDGSRKLFEELETDINDIRFSPGGNFIAVGVDSGDVLVWRVRTGQLVERFKGHCDWVFSVAFTPDGTGLVSGSRDRTIKFWDMSLIGRDGRPTADKNIGKEILNFKEHKKFVFFVAVSSNGHWIVSCSYDGVVRIWDARNAELQCELYLNNHDMCMEHFDLSPVGGSSVTSSAMGDQVLIWRFKES